METKLEVSSDDNISKLKTSVLKRTRFWITVNFGVPGRAQETPVRFALCFCRLVLIYGACALQHLSSTNRSSASREPTPRDLKLNAEIEAKQNAQENTSAAVWAQQRDSN